MTSPKLFKIFEEKGSMNIWSSIENKDVDIYKNLFFGKTSK